jgi:type IV pilus assembly protein PilF
MRHESIRLVAAALFLAGVAGCASTSDGGRDGTLSSKENMTQGGLANIRLAQSYLSAGKFDLAMDRATRALRSDPDSAEAHVVMGLILERLEQDARAGEHYMRAAKLEPDQGFVMNAAGVWLCEHKRYAEAEPMFARGVEDLLYSHRLQVFHNAGKCAADGGDFARAETYLRSGLNLAPQDPHLLGQMIRVKFHQGDLMGARAFLQRREALGAPGAAMLELAVKIEERAGDSAAAARYRQQLATQHPGYTAPPANGSQP